MSLDRRSLLKLLPIAGVRIPLQSPVEDAAAIPLPAKERIVAVLHLKQPATQELARLVYETLRENLDRSGMKDVEALVVPAFAQLDFYALPHQGADSCSVSESPKPASSAQSR